MVATGTALLVHAGAVAVAVAGVETKRRWLLVVGKPLATLALLLVMGWPPWPASLVARAVMIGILFSTAGDVALLGEGGLSFALGLGLFLCAHGAYLVAAGFGGGLSWAPAPGRPALAVVALLLFGITAWVVARAWRGVGAALRPAIVVYGLVISTMVSVAILTLAGPWPRQVAAAVALGALLFYASDGVLAWNRFVRPLRHGQTLTLLLYWSGQAGLALAARWGTR